MVCFWHIFSKPREVEGGCHYQGYIKTSPDRGQVQVEEFSHLSLQTHVTSSSLPAFLYPLSMQSRLAPMNHHTEPSWKTTDLVSGGARAVTNKAKDWGAWHWRPFIWTDVSLGVRHILCVQNNHFHCLREDELFSHSQPQGSRISLDRSQEESHKLETTSYLLHRSAASQPFHLHTVTHSLFQ